MKIKDPREVFPTVAVPAREYVVHNAIGHKLLAKSKDEPADELELAKDFFNLRTNPLLAEAGLFDTLTIEKRTPTLTSVSDHLRPYLSTIRTLDLVVTVRKASHDEILAQLPGSILVGEDKVRVIHLQDHLDAEDEMEYIAPVLRTPTRLFATDSAEASED